VALDQSFVGRSYPPVGVYEVSREKIAEFARAIGDANPIYTDVEAAKAAGYPDVIAPPTFSTILNIQAIETLVADPELGFSYDRMVHGDQRFTFARPLRAGDRLQVTTHIDRVQTRMGNDLLDVRAEITTVDGEYVATARAQLVSRGEDQ